jgi:hypothetical protein
VAEFRLAPGFEDAIRARIRTPEGTEAMNRLVGLIVEAAVKTFPPDLLATLGTPEGRKAFEDAWPQIVDAYFHALRNPKRGSDSQNQAGPETLRDEGREP